MISEIFKIVFSYGLLGVLALIVLYWLLFPEKAEIASGQLYKLLRHFWGKAEKKYIAHDTQGRVNDFVNNFLSKEIKDFSSVNMKLEWVEDGFQAESFFRNGLFIVRMRKSENQNKNIVNAAIVFIAQNVLNKAKRYISTRQQESIDLFVAKKLFEREKEELMTQFVDDYLIEKTNDQKIGEFFEKYHYIDIAGLFFPVFVQEMHFLGEKAFAKRKDQSIYTEVNGLVDFLDNYSLRKVGDTSVPTRFDGLYCRFGIMIVGIGERVKSEGFAPYEKHIKHLRDSGVETIYLVGDIKNKDFMQELCNSICNDGFDFSIYNKKDYKATISYRDEHRETKDNFLVVLRKNSVKHYFPTNRS